MRGAHAGTAIPAAVPRNFTWLASLVCLAEAVELTGDAEPAAALHRHLLPYSGWLADLPQTVIAPVDLASPSWR